MLLKEVLGARIMNISPNIYIIKVIVHKLWSPQLGNINVRPLPVMTFPAIFRLMISLSYLPTYLHKCRHTFSQLISHSSNYKTDHKLHDTVL